MHSGIGRDLLPLFRFDHSTPHFPHAHGHRHKASRRDAAERKVSLETARQDLTRIFLISFEFQDSQAAEPQSLVFSHANEKGRNGTANPATNSQQESNSYHDQISHSGLRERGNEVSQQPIGGMKVAHWTEQSSGVNLPFSSDPAAILRIPACALCSVHMSTHAMIEQLLGDHAVCCRIRSHAIRETQHLKCSLLPTDAKPLARSAPRYRKRREELPSILGATTYSTFLLLLQRRQRYTSDSDSQQPRRNRRATHNGDPTVLSLIRSD